MNQPLTEHETYNYLTEEEQYCLTVQSSVREAIIQEAELHGFECSYLSNSQLNWVISLTPDLYMEFMLMGHQLFLNNMIVEDERFFTGEDFTSFFELIKGNKTIISTLEKMFK